MHVLIVGGGLGGLSLAQCLRKQGVSFDVFERDTSPDSRFQGWAIAIHTIIDELAAAFPSDVPDLKQATDHLKPLNLPAQMGLYFPGKEGRLGIQDSPEAPIVRAERRRLRDWLSTNIPIQWGKRVKHIEHDDKGVSVYFEDGKTAKGDVLVGADGINSVVREHLLQHPSSELLKTVPLTAIVGELTLEGEAFKRQLALGHSMYVYVNPDLGFWNFSGLHHVLPNGVSGRHYWMLMQPDTNVGDPNHWLQTASQQEKLDHVLKCVSKLPPKFREIFELTPASGIKKEVHIWRDLELDISNLPAGRVIIMGDAAHAMTPFRGEGGYHTFIDAMKLAKVLSQVNGKDLTALKVGVAEYNAEMLERGSDAVRTSRDIHSTKGSANQVARPLPDEEIVLTELKV